jgi:hypothetical protein
VTLTRVSKQVLAVNAILAGLAVFCAVSLVRDLTHSRSLPAPPAPRRAAALKPGDDPAASAIRGETLGAYNVIVAKHLFNPSRSEGGPVASAPAAPAAPKPMLMGVVVDGGQSRAYLEDPASKRVLSYQVGDTVSGGRIEQITSEKVLIVRPEGPVEVMLRDPLKPKPAAAPSAVNAPNAGAGPRADSPVAPPRGPVPPLRAPRRPGAEPPQPSQQ